MKNKLLCWAALVTLVFLCLPVTAWALDNPVGVAYRGHIQDRGDYPADGSWIASPEIIGTTGQSKRIEGFEIKLTGEVPAGLELRYNVHVQNKGWLYDEDDSTDWPKDGAYVGTRGDSLRIEAVKIVLTDGDGQPLPGYSVQYRGHVQNVGDLPADKTQWLADGAQLGTVGSSLRLEALLVQVVKTAVDPPEPAEPVVYDSTGTYGPTTGTETIAGDVTVAADGLILQNLVIAGDLTISKEVGDGAVTLNNVTVKGDTLVRGGGKNSIHINGGQYSRIIMEKTASGAVRIVATGVDGLEVVIAEDASGETIILEGAFASVTVNAPNMIVTTQGATTTIGTLIVGADAGGTTLNLASGTTVSDLILDAKAAVKGQGSVTKAVVKADDVVFEKAPGAYSVAPGLVSPPVFPAPNPGGGGGGGTPIIPTLTISDPVIMTAKVYDGNTSAAVTAGSLSGVAAGDVGNVTVSATASYDNKNVSSGNKTIRVVYSLSGSAAANYIKPADYVLTTGTITAKPLTITSMPTVTTTKLYDGSTSAVVMDNEATDVIAGDQLTVTPTASYADKNWGDTKPITIVYTLSGDDVGNYSAPASSEVTGKITKKPLSVQISSAGHDKVYDKTIATFVTVNAGSLSGMIGEEDVYLSKATAYYDSADAGPRTITVEATLDGDDCGNYQIENMTTSGEIKPRPLTASTTTVTITKKYNSLRTAAITGGGELNGVLLGDDVSATPTANYDTKDVGENKTITVNFSLTGNPAVTKNYSAPADQTILNGTITAKPLTIFDFVVNKVKAYDGTAAAVIGYHGYLSGNYAVDELTPVVTAWYDNPDVGTQKQITASFQVTGKGSQNYSTLGTYDIGSNGVIKKVIRVTSYNSAAGWSDLADVTGITMTSLPAGYRIFDRDNDGNIYAWASDGSIKKYSGGSWSEAFSNANKPDSLQFAGIDIDNGKPTAYGVASSASGVDLYQNNIDNPSWNVTEAQLNNTANYQLVGGYYDTSNFYLVYRDGANLFKYDFYETNPVVSPMSLLAGGVNIPAGYTICGFNYTNGKLNMYLTR